MKTVSKTMVDKLYLKLVELVDKDLNFTSKLFQNSPMNLKRYAPVPNMRVEAKWSGDTQTCCLSITLFCINADRSVYTFSVSTINYENQTAKTEATIRLIKSDLKSCLATIVQEYDRHCTQLRLENHAYQNENCTLVLNNDDQRLEIYDSHNQFVDYYGLESRSEDEVRELLWQVTRAAKSGSKALCDKLVHDLECVDGPYRGASYKALADTYGEEYVNRIGKYCVRILE